MTTVSAFDLPARLAAKAAPTLIADDERHFAVIAASLDASIAELTRRMDDARRESGGVGQKAMDRDLEVHRLASRLRTLRRFGLDLCLGRMVDAATGETRYVGRAGLTDSAGGRLLADWRSPAAEPFFGATHADPMGLASRRRYRWTQGRIVDYWDEVFDDDFDGHAALDDQSAFIASLGGARSPQMRDVLGTIQADQDAIIRAGSRGTLVVDGGPGTGKTVVALHRTAYLLYADPRLGQRRGGVLFVGPSQPYLTYVADVLPSLGEDGVRTTTLRDLVPEGATAPPEPDDEVARLKARAAMVAAIEPAVRLYEEPPTTGMEVETPWADLWLSPGDWVEVFDGATGVPHNEARDQIWSDLLDLLCDKHESPDDEDAEVTREGLRRSLAQNATLRETLTRAWPMIEATDLVGDLWEVPAYLRRCAPWLRPEEVRLLQRSEARAWTTSDLQLLDAARQRLGDPATSLARRRREAALQTQREDMREVIDGLITAVDDNADLVSSLRQHGLREALVDADAAPDVATDPLAGPFAHIVVDEAQELTDAEWRMLLLRCPTRSFTVVGDRAQARHGFTESWTERLERVGLSDVELATLRVNYRTPQEVMAEAEPVIRAVLPDANVPTSIRSNGVPVTHAPVADLSPILTEWLATSTDGLACVIGTGDLAALLPRSLTDSGRIRPLTPELSKGLEFDLVVLLDPETFGDGDRPVVAAVDRYVAMTRATQRLVVLTND